MRQKLYIAACTFATPLSVFFFSMRIHPPVAWFEVLQRQSLHNC